MKIPLRIVRDTREQLKCGWMFAEGFDPAPIVTVAKLETGDYSLVGHEQDVVVERKTLQDLVGCLGIGRDRFEREMHRMKGIASAIVIVEAPQSLLRRGKYRGQLLPESAWQSVVSFTCRYRVPFAFCRNAREAERLCFDFLRHYANGFVKKMRAIQKAEGESVK